MEVYPDFEGGRTKPIKANCGYFTAENAEYAELDAERLAFSLASGCGGTQNWCFRKFTASSQEIMTIEIE